MHFTRRQFLSTTVHGAVLATLGAGQGVSSVQAQTGKTPQVGTKQWYRGNLHMHSQWSDGQPLPEWAVSWYKEHGYHFICLSDHNLIQTAELSVRALDGGVWKGDMSAFRGETSRWKPISPKPGRKQLSPVEIQQVESKFGKKSLRRKRVGNQTFVRLRPFSELEKQFSEPGRFLMIPGFEQTGNAKDGRAVHMNFIHVRQTFPYVKGKTPLQVLRKTFQAGRKQYGRMPYLFTVNHPRWKFYDISPQMLIQLPQIRLVELNNNGIHRDYDAHPQGWSGEKFWDVVNAYRASHQQPLLFGMGSDDRHVYVGKAAKAWTMVRAENLSVAALFAAIQAGDFYASNGIQLLDIQFDGKTLTVRVKPPKKGSCRIQFIGTRKGYDSQPKKISIPKSKRTPARTLEVYSDTIGVVLATVDGTEGSYTLQAEDLYVRAKITRTGTDKSVSAWTQPVAFEPAHGE